MKKTYLKPEAEYVNFYSEEDIAASLDLGSNIDETPDLTSTTLPEGTDWV